MYKGITLVAVFSSKYPYPGKIWKILPNGEWGDDVDSCYIVLDEFRANITKNRLFGLSALGMERVLQEAFNWSWAAEKACCERHNTNLRISPMPTYGAEYFTEDKSS
jgi:hypothetical protein